MAEGEEGKEWKVRLRRIEVKQDKNERDGRRNNVMVTEIGKGNEGGSEQAVGKYAGGGGGIKKVVKIGGLGRDGSGMVLMKLEGWEEKRKVMKAKKKLRVGERG